MMAKNEVLNQLSEPQRIVAQVLGEKWPEVREACADNSGEFCDLTNQECSFSTCPKLERNQNNGEGDKYGERD